MSDDNTGRPPQEVIDAVKELVPACGHAECIAFAMAEFMKPALQAIIEEVPGGKAGFRAAVAVATLSAMSIQYRRLVELETMEEGSNEPKH